MKILIIGAFDRYNYGDLLFPLVIEKQLKAQGIEAEFEFFGLVKSDLSEVGGLPTEGLQEFYQECDNPEEKVNVIIAGGEALGVTWNSLYAALNPLFQKINKRHVRISKFFNLNRFAQKILKGRTELPFVFDKKDFKGVNSVVLNSLGGSGLSAGVFVKYYFLKNKLKKADYFAVRDRVTLSNLAQEGIKADLFPDSAILMSEFYPFSWLEQNVSPEVKAYVSENRGEYVFVQINKKTTKGKLDIIAREVDRIYSEGKTSICLCPIGKALDHDDDVALKDLGSRLTCPYKYFDADTIWDIMYLIGESKCYAGTSLHGAITAMSYAVPHVGLKVEKLNAYLNTWGVEGNNFAVEFSGLFDQFQLAKNLAKHDLELSRDTQLREIKQAFEKMAEVMH
jgi:hypothetical protein